MASRKFRATSLPPQFSELASVLSGDLPLEQKLAALQKEFHAVLLSNRKLEKQCVDSDKKCVDLSSQRESIQGQLTKAVVAKSTLESLCRELQKHSKAVSDDTKLKVTEEKLARKEVAAQFQCQIDEITTQMQEQNQRNLKLEHENVEMRAIIEQFDSREENIRRLFEKKEIEIKLSEARAAQFEILLQQQRETANTERDIMMLQSNEKHRIYEETIMKEVEMRTEIEFYSAKFQEVQETMAKSGEAFEMLKRELDKKDKIIKRLDNDRERLIKKLEIIETTRRELKERAGENKKELSRLTNKNTTLEGLCRALQEERTQLKSKIIHLEECHSGDTILTPLNKPELATPAMKESIENGITNGTESPRNDAPEIGIGIKNKDAPEIGSNNKSPPEIEIRTKNESPPEFEIGTKCDDAPGIAIGTETKIDPGSENGLDSTDSESTLSSSLEPELKLEPELEPELAQ